MDNVKVEFWEKETCIVQAQRLADFFHPLVHGDRSDYEENLSRRKSLMTVVALDNGGAIVGAKLGYERRPDIFNSAVGGVVPEYRVQGLAAKLLKAQHEWAKQAGFRAVETATLQNNRAMGIVNLKGGFVVAGLDMIPGTDNKVVFYKDLTAQQD